MKFQRGNRSLVNDIGNGRADYNIILCQVTSISFYYKKIYDQDIYCLRVWDTSICERHFYVFSPRANLNFHYIPRNDLENLPTLSPLSHPCIREIYLTCYISYHTFWRSKKWTNFCVINVFTIVCVSTNEKPVYVPS